MLQKQPKTPKNRRQSHSDTSTSATKNSFHASSLMSSNSKRPKKRQIIESDTEDGGDDLSDHDDEYSNEKDLNTEAALRYIQNTPVIPAAIVRTVVGCVKGNVRKKTAFVECVCRYWSLKRESRRGAPLLKRLHLEVNAFIINILI